MPRHARTLDRRWRATRITTLAVVWLAGLAAGLFALLAAAARYGCGAADPGLACHSSGSVLAVVLVLAVVAIVTTATVLSHERAPRRVATIGVLGVVGLALCLVAARALLGTV